MHELALSRAIVDAVERHAAGRRVTAVSMRIGALRQVIPDSLDFYFGIVARETVCEGARLSHELVAASLRCPECGREWDPAPPPPAAPSFRCPECGSGGATLRGNEFEVESIVVEEQCTAPG